MANKTCRYNASIQCDAKYEFDEFYRQIKSALKSGQGYSCYIGGECPVDKNLCPRYLTGVQAAKTSATCCPYDDTPCDVKEQKLLEFTERVHHLAKNTINQVFFQDSDNKCPINPEKCVRYKRYLNIMNKIKANEK